MKQLLFTVLFSIPCIGLSAQPHKMVIKENEDIEVYVLYRDTASLDQVDWLKVFIQNKTSNLLRIESADFSSHQGAKGSAAQIFPASFKNDETGQAQLQIETHDALISNAFLNNNTCAYLDEFSRKSDKICSEMLLSVTYIVNEKRKNLTSSGVPFCFYWKVYEETPPEKMLVRVRAVISQGNPNGENAKLITRFLKHPELAKQYSSDALIQSIMDEKIQYWHGDLAVYFQTLFAKEALPNSRLTAFYRKKIKEPNCQVSTILCHYWENEMLDDLLQSDMSLFEKEQVLEKTETYWAVQDSNKTKVYHGLMHAFRIKEIATPDAHNFEDWRKQMKLLSISRSKEIVEYLEPFLDEEAVHNVLITGYLTEQYIKRENASLVRPCDVAFVSLARALGLTRYMPELVSGMPHSNAFFYGTKLFPQMWYLGPDDLELEYADLNVKLSPEMKQLLKDYIRFMKQ